MCDLVHKRGSIQNKILFSLFLFFCVFGCVNAKTITVMECEYTDQYKQWLALPDSEKRKILEPVKCKVNDKFFTSVGTNVSETYQSPKFDLRDYSYVTSIKDQSTTGLCWTFATNASLESNLLMKNQGSYDFSEAHIGYSVQNGSFQGLMPVNKKYDDGGNYYLSSAYLFNRMGPVSESDMPFSHLLDVSKNNNFPSASDLASKQVKFSVNSAAFFNSDKGKCSSDAITSIKKYLVSQGAIGATMFFDLGKGVDVNDNLELVSNTLNGPYYYYDGSSWTGVLQNSGINHAVTIIGWDDNVEASKFSTTPSRNGAWIVKNSYGTMYDIGNGVNVPMGDNGYYYVSYDDINICTSLGGFYDISSTVEDNAYYHDTIGVDSGILFSEDVYLANLFEKKYSGAEKLKKVTFFSGAPNQKYDILVSLDGNLSNSEVVASGVTDRVGYITVDINNIDLANPKFGVAVKYYYTNDAIVYIYDDLDYSFFHMDTVSGLSYLSQNGEEWDNLSYGEKNYYASIRAYTDNLDYSFAYESISFDDDKMTVLYDYSNIDDLSKVKYNVYKANDTSYSNSLNDSFSIVNDLESGKTISVGITDKTVEGDYVFVAQYEDIKIVADFKLSLDNEGVLFFGENFVDDEDNDVNDSGDIEIEIEDNPLNSDTDGDISAEEDIENPKTGGVDNVGLMVIIILSLSVALGINFYIQRKNEG